MEARGFPSRGVRSLTPLEAPDGSESEHRANGTSSQLFMAGQLRAPNRRRTLDTDEVPDLSRPIFAIVYRDLCERFDGSATKMAISRAWNSTSHRLNALALAHIFDDACGEAVLGDLRQYTFLEDLPEYSSSN